MTNRPLVIGHRGAPGYLPELTEPSLRLAVAQGARALEIDVVPSKDGVLVLRHENELTGTTDVAGRPEFADRRRDKLLGRHARRGWFAEDFAIDELRTLRARERLPALRPGSAAHDGQAGIIDLRRAIAIADELDVLLVIEVKHPGWFVPRGLDPVPILADTLRGVPASRVVIESFERTALDRLAELRPDLRMVPLFEVLGIAADARDRPGGAPYLAELRHPERLEHYAALSVPTAILTRGLVDRAARSGLPVWSWTLRPENRFLPWIARAGRDSAGIGHYAAYWRRLARTGVAAVFADHPDLAVQVLHA